MKQHLLHFSAYSTLGRGGGDGAREYGGVGLYLLGSPGPCQSKQGLAFWGEHWSSLLSSWVTLIRSLSLRFPLCKFEIIISLPTS